jgi:hypothetical protein
MCKLLRCVTAATKSVKILKFFVGSPSHLNKMYNFVKDFFYQDVSVCLSRPITPEAFKDHSVCTRRNTV